MCVLSIKVPKRKKSGNLFNDPRVNIYTYIYIYIYIYIANFYNRLLHINTPVLAYLQRLLHISLEDLPTAMNRERERERERDGERIFLIGIITNLLLIL